MIGIKMWFRNLKLRISILWHSLFRGMKAADDKTMGVTKEGKTIDVGIEEQIQEHSVYTDLLNEQITQEVMELRDSNYRVFRHANDFQYIGNGNVVQKVKNMLQADLKVFNPDNDRIVLVQDNKLVVKGLVEATKDVEEEGEVVADDKAERFTLKFEREVFPRFQLEKWVKKIVVRQNDEGLVRLDLYCSSYARQFMPTDSLFINELMNIYGKKTRNIDTVDIMSVEFITDKAYGADDITLYRFEELKYEGMNMYDKDFVITYIAKPVQNLDLTEKYKTKEMDEKYATKARRENAKPIDMEEYVAYQAQNTLDVDEALNLLKSLDISNDFNSEGSAE